MTWWNVRTWAHKEADQPRRAQFSAVPRPLDDVIAEMKNASGRVNRDEALSVPAVLKGRDLICSIATLPLVLYGPGRSITDSSLLKQIDPTVPNVVTLAQTVEDLLFSGVSWWRVTGRDYPGFPVTAEHLDVDSVSTQPPDGRRLNPLPEGNDPRGAVVWVHGVETPMSELIRFDSPNPPLLVAGARAIKIAIMIDRMAALYSTDPRPHDYFQTAEGERDLEPEEAESWLARWSTSRKKRATAYIPSTMQYQVVDSPNPRDLQLVELKRQASLDIANALGIDPEEVGVNTTSRTYFNAQDRRQARINDMLAPYMLAITERLSMNDVTRRGYVTEFDLNNYMKADPTTRTAYYAAMSALGAMNVKEIRAQEGLSASFTPDPKPEPVAPVAESNSGSEPQDVQAARFDGPELTLMSVPTTSFSVNRETRTIRGTALPYAETGSNGMGSFRFQPGSLTWSDASRVKLLRDHDFRQPLGVAFELTDTPDGLTPAFKIARGTAGDEAISLAEDGVLDGFSVGVDIIEAGPGEDGVTLVRKAVLREVSLTAMPAFDSARVSSVAASRTTTEEGQMPENTPVTATGPAAPGNADLIAAFAAAINGQQKPVEEVERPEVITASRATPMQVTEAVPYRFDRDGNILPGSHDFSSDLVDGLRNGDRAAYDRAFTFVRAQFDATNTTDVAGLNPTKQRPDMYVDQRSYRYPLWEAISKGSLSDVTPFTFPKFSAATGLVGDHTQGTEPTVGDFTVTTQTVTPTAISGKAEINREVWDQGGNPQVSNLIWRQMVKGWYEALEAAAVAVLDAASPTQLATFTAGGGTNKQTLVSELTAGLASLQFVRGGFSMDKMFAQVDLYKDLIAAKDGNARPIYPALGPQNTYGTVASRFGAIEVAPGVTALPAWALAASGSVAASSYLFDSDCVHGWASAPQRLDFDYQVKSVFIGIWGYKATAISDITGVREITYDPMA